MRSNLVLSCFRGKPLLSLRYEDFWFRTMLLMTDITCDIKFEIDSPICVTWLIENCNSKNLPGVAEEIRLATERT
ncbi:MAG: hypothetical protein AB7H48_00610 [Parachlamydiales bacterium]|nr:hypothetical protein [Verrucomicrobiota bacterium]